MAAVMIQFTVDCRPICYHFFRMKILQITDPHLYGHASAKLRGVETDSTLRNVLDEAFMEVPDYAAILVTGDLVQDDPAGYLRFRSIFGNSPQARSLHSGQSRRAGSDAPRRSASRRFSIAEPTALRAGNSSCSTATMRDTRAVD